MESTLIAVDTAKLVFEVAEAGGSGKVSRRLRLNREQFSQYLATRSHASFVLEACGGAHHWARRMQACGHTVRLLPVPYEPPREFRRLHHLRVWSHDQSLEVFPGSAGARGPDGGGARGAAHLAVGSD